jgi:ribosome-associated protein
MKSSHERVKLDAAALPAPLRAGRKARPRVRSLAPVEAREAPRGPRKARAPERPLSTHAGPAPGEWSVATPSARETATAIAIAALDKKAAGLQILDVAGRVDYADFLVIMTGRSDRHAQALAQGIEDAMRSRGLRPVAVEGLQHGSWVLMDFGEVVVHVFQNESRELYDIDGLWLDARRLPVPGPVETE